jgi:hypothetical protein
MQSLLRFKIVPFMSRFRWLSRFAKLWLEFWLPLLLITVGLWFGSQWLNERVLSQTYTTATQLDAEREQVKLTLNFTILSINAEVDRRAGNTEVTVQTAGSALQELEFEFPITAFAELEQAIANELSLPIHDIRTLIRYRID